MDEAPMMGVLRAGAAGYIRKDAEPETLLAAVVFAQWHRARPTSIPASAVGTFYKRRLRPTILRRGSWKCSGNWPWAARTKRSRMSFRSGEETSEIHTSATFSGKLQVENRSQAIVRAR